MPCCAEGPCRLLMVQQSGAQPWWEPVKQPCGDRRMHVCVRIPVCCQVMDACERLHSASAIVKVETALRLSCPPSECWRYQLVMIPYVRLLDAECSGDCGVFCARLEVQLEWYQLRPEVCGMRRPEPAMPGAAAVSAADSEGLFLRMRDGMVEAKIETKGDPAAGTAGFLHMLTNWAEILAILRFHTVCAKCQAH